MNNALCQSQESEWELPVLSDDVLLRSEFLDILFEDPNVRKYESDFRALFDIEEGVMFSVIDSPGERTISFSLGERIEKLYMKAAIQGELQSVLERKISQVEDKLNKLHHGLEWKKLAHFDMVMGSDEENIRDNMDQLEGRLEKLDPKKDGLEIKNINIALSQLKLRLEKVVTDIPRRQKVLKGLRETHDVHVNSRLEDLSEDQERLVELGIRLPAGHLARCAQEQLIAFKKLSHSRKIISDPIIRPQIISAGSNEKETVVWWVSRLTGKVRGLIFATMLISASFAWKKMENETYPLSKETPGSILPPAIVPFPEVLKITRPPAVDSSVEDFNYLSTIELWRLAQSIKCNNIQECFDSTISVLATHSKEDPHKSYYIGANFAKLMTLVLKNNSIFHNGYINWLGKVIYEDPRKRGFTFSDSRGREWTTFVMYFEKGKPNSR